MSQQSPDRQQPARRQPDYVYRRRRLVVFGTLGLVLLLIVILLWHPWSHGGRKSAQPLVTIPAAAPNPTSTSAAAATAPACAKSNVAVTALTDAASYASGQYPQLTLQVENTGSSACSLNVGTSQQVFTISSGGEIYWLSTDCQVEKSDYNLVLQPKTPVSSEPIAWDRTRSNPGTCQLAQRDPVPAGGASYQLTASVDGIASPAVSFALS